MPAASSSSAHCSTHVHQSMMGCSAADAPPRHPACSPSHSQNSSELLISFPYPSVRYEVGSGLLLSNQHQAQCEPKLLDAAEFAAAVQDIWAQQQAVQMGSISAVPPGGRAILPVHMQQLTHSLPLPPAAVISAQQVDTMGGAMALLQVSQGMGSNSVCDAGAVSSSRQRTEGVRTAGAGSSATSSAQKPGRHAAATEKNTGKRAALQPLHANTVAARPPRCSPGPKNRWVKAPPPPQPAKSHPQSGAVAMPNSLRYYTSSSTLPPCDRISEGTTFGSADVASRLPRIALVPAHTLNLCESSFRKPTSSSSLPFQDSAALPSVCEPSTFPAAHNNSLPVSAPAAETIGMAVPTPGLCRSSSHQSSDTLAVIAPLTSTSIHTHQLASEQAQLPLCFKGHGRDHPTLSVLVRCASPVLQPSLDAPHPPATPLADLVLCDAGLALSLNSPGSHPEPNAVQALAKELEGTPAFVVQPAGQPPATVTSAAPSAAVDASPTPTLASVTVSSAPAPNPLMISAAASIATPAPTLASLTVSSTPVSTALVSAAGMEVQSAAAADSFPVLLAAATVQDLPTFLGTSGRAHHVMQGMSLPALSRQSGAAAAVPAQLGSPGVAGPAGMAHPSSIACKPSDVQGPTIAVWDHLLGPMCSHVPAASGQQGGGRSGKRRRSTPTPATSAAPAMPCHAMRKTRAQNK